MRSEPKAAHFRAAREQSLVLVIDVQERLFAAVHPTLAPTIEANLVRIGEAQRILALPGLLSEQYPKGLGPTIPTVRDAFIGLRPMEKVEFDALRNPQIADSFSKLDRRTVIVAGLETHICVFSSVRSLLERGHSVFVLRDATGARTLENHEIGLDLCRRMGAVVSSTEAVLFDLIGGADAPEFKAISKLLR